MNTSSFTWSAWILDDNDYSKLCLCKVSHTSANRNRGLQPTPEGISKNFTGRKISKEARTDAN